MDVSIIKIYGYYQNRILQKSKRLDYLAPGIFYSAVKLTLGLSVP